jgi:hypothetical protein
LWFGRLTGQSRATETSKGSDGDGGDIQRPRQLTVRDHQRRTTGALGRCSRNGDCHGDPAKRSQGSDSFTLAPLRYAFWARAHLNRYRLFGQFRIYSHFCHFRRHAVICMCQLSDSRDYLRSNFVRCSKTVFEVEDGKGALIQLVSESPDKCAIVMAVSGDSSCRIALRQCCLGQGFGSTAWILASVPAPFADGFRSGDRFITPLFDRFCDNLTEQTVGTSATPQPPRCRRGWAIPAAPDAIPRSSGPMTTKGPESMHGYLNNDPARCCVIGILVC